MSPTTNPAPTAMSPTDGDPDHEGFGRRGGRRHRRPTALLAGGLAAGVLLLAAGALGVGRSGRPDRDPPPAVAPPVALEDGTSGAAIDATITDLQARLAEVPGDYVSWATLGLAYVQAARITIDPSYYPRAEGALARSLEIADVDNYLAYAGLSALASARHDFDQAREHAETGLAINPYSALLYGALSDALIQLGEYDAAFDAVQRMVDLRPDTASLARASYTWELRGDIDRARTLMQRALDDAPTADDRAFALFQLGELDFNAGDPESALQRYRAALEAAPEYPSALAGEARALAALGDSEAAVAGYAAVVERAPEPSYLLEYGELLESLGRSQEAEAQYEVFRLTQELFAANGVRPDAVRALFEADHGEPAEALIAAEAALVENPFLSAHDAHAWALHRLGRDEEALVAVDRALALGYDSALFRYHAGMISLALGDEDRARDELSTALSLNPSFSPLGAAAAREALSQLGDGS